MSYDDIFEKQKSLREREQELREELNLIEDESRDIKEKYFKELAGDKYDEIKGILEDLEKYCFSSHESLNDLNREVKYLCLKATKRLYSEKIVTDAKVSKEYSGHKYNVVINYKGFYTQDIDRHWGGNQASRVKKLETLKNIFELDYDFKQHIWKDNKKNCIDILKKYLPKYQTNKPEVSERINFSTKTIKKEGKEYLDIESSKFDVLKINLHSWGYTEILLMGHGNQETVIGGYGGGSFDDKSIYQLSKIWKEVGDKLKEIAKRYRDLYKANEKVYKDLKDELTTELLIQKL